MIDETVMTDHGLRREIMLRRMTSTEGVLHLPELSANEFIKRQMDLVLIPYHHIMTVLNTVVLAAARALRIERRQVDRRQRDGDILALLLQVYEEFRLGLAETLMVHATVGIRADPAHLAEMIQHEMPEHHELIQLLPSLGCETPLLYHRMEMRIVFQKSANTFDRIVFVLLKLPHDYLLCLSGVIKTENSPRRAIKRTYQNVS